MISDPKKYAPGTSGYQRIADHYGGTAAADYVYRAALTMRDGAVTEALNNLTDSNGRPPSAWSVFATQIYNDPFGAPLEQVGNVVKNATKAAVGNWGVWILVLLLIVVAFFYFGGGAAVRRRVSNA